LILGRTTPETTRGTQALCSHIFKYATATGRLKAIDVWLRVALKKFRKGHYASISVDEFPTFLMRMHEYCGRISRQTFLALQMLLLTFVRTAELI
jgi:integrase